jgi:hypothetical protein
MSILTLLLLERPDHLAAGADHLPIFSGSMWIVRMRGA